MPTRTRTRALRRRPKPTENTAAKTTAKTTGPERRARRFAERDVRILDVARRLVAERGYPCLSMEAIGDAIGYSKGIVYLHYRSKEDVLAALAVETGRKRTELFARATAFRGRPRERLAAVGEAYAKFVREYPHHFRVEQEIHSSQVRTKASDERRTEIEACDDAGREIVWGLIRDGIEQGDLVLPPGVGVADIGFGLWSLTFGAFFLMSSGIDLERRGIGDPHATVRRAVNAYLDGIGWRPLWAEWDYPATYARIQSEVFARGT